MEFHTQESLWLVHGISCGDQRSRVSISARISGAIGRLIRALRREIEYRRSLDQLKRLDDRLLRDIGVEPHKVRLRAHAGGPRLRQTSGWS